MADHLHILLNPYGHGADAVRAARIWAGDELTRLRAEVEKSDAALQKIGIALCNTDEWTDQATMLGSVVAVAEEFRAEVERLTAEVEALRADAARLDAIEGNLWFVEPRYQYDPVQFGVGKADTMKVAKTLRAAIDAQGGGNG